MKNIDGSITTPEQHAENITSLAQACRQTIEAGLYDSEANLINNIAIYSEQEYKEFLAARLGR
jgi:hypothetical protein